MYEFETKCKVAEEGIDDVLDANTPSKNTQHTLNRVRMKPVDE